MPSTMTHCYFAQDVYNKINNNSRKKINGFLDKLLTFSMGSDPFMFYHFFVGKKNKEIANIQKTVHTEKTNEYFYNIIDYIIKNNLTNDKEIISFLYGMICHYFLDKNTHPFIYYKSGIFDKNNSDTYKYNTLHHKIEYAIDIYMIKKKEKEYFSSFKFYNKVFNVNSLNKNLNKLINDVFMKTYEIENASKIYVKSLKYMFWFNRLFNYDKYGIKREIYKLIDKITDEKHLKIEVLSYNTNDNDISNYLNLKKEKWNHPGDILETYNYSFIDLYNISIEECVNCINDLNIILERKNIDEQIFTKHFKDLSYVSNKKWNKVVELKYFEF